MVSNDRNIGAPASEKVVGRETIGPAGNLPPEVPPDMYDTRVLCGLDRTHDHRP